MFVENAFPFLGVMPDAIAAEIGLQYGMTAVMKDGSIFVILPKTPSYVHRSANDVLSSADEVWWDQLRSALHELEHVALNNTIDTTAPATRGILGAISPTTRALIPQSTRAWLFSLAAIFNRLSPNRSMADLYYSLEKSWEVLITEIHTHAYADYAWQVFKERAQQGSLPNWARPFPQRFIDSNISPSARFPDDAGLLAGQPVDFANPRSVFNYIVSQPEYAGQFPAEVQVIWTALSDIERWGRPEDAARLAELLDSVGIDRAMVETLRAQLSSHMPAHLLNPGSAAFQLMDDVWRQKTGFSAMAPLVPLSLVTSPTTTNGFATRQSFLCGPEPHYASGSSACNVYCGSDAACMQNCQALISAHGITNACLPSCGQLVSEAGYSASPSAGRGYCMHTSAVPPEWKASEHWKDLGQTLDCALQGADGAGQLKHCVVYTGCLEPLAPVTVSDPYGLHESVTECRSDCKGRATDIGMYPHHPLACAPSALRQEEVTTGWINLGPSRECGTCLVNERVDPALVNPVAVAYPSAATSP